MRRPDQLCSIMTDYNLVLLTSARSIDFERYNQENWECKLVYIRDEQMKKIIEEQCDAERTTQQLDSKGSIR
jgi:hypothetical protein